MTRLELLTALILERQKLERVRDELRAERIKLEAAIDAAYRAGAA
jgi:hypothetical protein